MDDDRPVMNMVDCEVFAPLCHRRSQKALCSRRWSTAFQHANDENISTPNFRALIPITANTKDDANHQCVRRHPAQNCSRAGHKTRLSALIVYKTDIAEMSRMEQEYRALTWDVCASCRRAFVWFLTVAARTGSGSALSWEEVC
ncbi:uncharacterized protein LAESUDRAFT_456359 [Laetiporus sulphureus 93-53]|uniref:Uncharacterized protein n=1 Tax=Laetiporus sulphureus 93-53 TaxID=1314785 RepID=A0A165BTC3_9APHY|nr:uncharacterized protein LAESUDRAFT_456359 [Laetiporus sulphureus 93-53]KZT01612.1 hypothetical protein LAESUDRAFT_456359 [Laetiporus sulphureus 93-53]